MINPVLPLFIVPLAMIILGIRSCLLRRRDDINDDK